MHTSVQGLKELGNLFQMLFDDFFFQVVKFS
jgi:hypothetical protein